MIKIGIVQIPSGIYLRSEDGEPYRFKLNDFAYTDFEVSSRRVYNSNYNDNYPDLDDDEEIDSIYISENDNFDNVINGEAHLIPLPNIEAIHEQIKNYGQLKIHYETMEEARASLKL